MTYYRLYGKYGNMKRFQAVDWKNGGFVGNLIHATIFNEDEAKQAIDEATKLNNDFIWELRILKDKEWGTHA